MAELSSGAKIAIGCSLLGAGGIGLLYFISKMKNANKKDSKNKGEGGGASLVGSAFSAAATLGGLGFIGVGGSEYYGSGSSSSGQTGMTGGRGTGYVDFCKETIGITEKEFAQKDTSEACEFLKDKVGPVSVSKFEKKSVGQLKSSTQGFKNNKQGSIHFLVGSGIDIKKLQAIPANNGATFQIASNFNCLETGQFFGDRSDSNSLQSVSAQGEQAVIQTMPAYLFRKHCISEKGRNLVSKLKATIQGELEIKNGTITKTPQTVCGNNYFSNLKSFLYATCVGIHRNIFVTHNEKLEKITGDKQIVNHVFVSALNRNIIVGPAYDRIENNFLFAAYYGTIYAAIYLKKASKVNMMRSNKVFLTLVGAGAFNNRIANIAKAMEEPLNIAKKNGLEVYVVCRMSNLSEPLENLRKKVGAEKFSNIC